jgi:hypothetical protein
MAAKKKVAKKITKKGRVMRITTKAGGLAKQLFHLPDQMFARKPSSTLDARVSGIHIKHPPMSDDQRKTLILDVVYELSGRFSRQELFWDWGSQDPKSTYIIGGDLYRLHRIAGFLECLWLLQNESKYAISYFHEHTKSYRGNADLSVSVIPKVNLRFFHRLQQQHAFSGNNKGMAQHMKSGMTGYISQMFFTTNDGQYLGLLIFAGKVIGHYASQKKSDVSIMFSAPNNAEFLTSRKNAIDLLDKYKGRKRKRKAVSKKEPSLPKTKKKAAKKKVVKKKVVRRKS